MKGGRGRGYVFQVPRFARTKDQRMYHQPPGLFIGALKLKLYYVEVLITLGYIENIYIYIIEREGVIRI